MAKRQTVKSTKKKKSSFGMVKKVFTIFGIIILFSCGILALNFYNSLFKNNISLEGENTSYLYIPTGSSYDDVLQILERRNLLLDKTSFHWTAELMKYPKNVKPGRYKLEENMGNRELITLLRSGRQEALKVTYNNLRKKEEFAGYVGGLLEFDSLEFVKLLNDVDFLREFGLNPAIVYTMFIPNTYEVYWNQTAEVFFRKMHKEYKAFWTDERKAKAKKHGLNPVSVTILASIVDSETARDSEMPTIAGVYMNRLKRGQRLQADPTVVFAVNDFTINRVLNKHIAFDSPYNTYKYSGLPPGPITMPSIKSIEAVLNRENHKYLYFCAKADFSGYHAFANTFVEHQRNAVKFRQALNKRNIMK
jgi:UPF0755 protein